MKRLLIIAALLGAATARDTWAGTVLDRVRHDQVVRCAAAERAGVAMPRPGGGIDGAAVDLCRAVTIAVLGSTGRFVFTIGTQDRHTDVTFITADDVTFQKHLIPGLAIFVDRLAVLVPETSAVQNVRDLAGETVCLMIGSSGQSALEAKVSDLGIDIARLGFEEDVEMHDAYAVGRCGAMVGGLSELSGLRGPFGVNRLTSRVLSEPLALVPIIAATPATDRQWAALVFGVTGKHGATPIVLRTSAPPSPHGSGH